MKRDIAKLNGGHDLMMARARYRETHGEDFAITVTHLSGVSFFIEDSNNEEEQRRKEKNPDGT
jgi:hypothetical protein